MYNQSQIANTGLVEKESPVFNLATTTGFPDANSSPLNAANEVCLHLHLQAGRRRHIRAVECYFGGSKICLPIWCAKYGQTINPIVGLRKAMYDNIYFLNGTFVFMNC